MPSPNPKKRKTDTSGTPSNWRRRLVDEDDDADEWKRLLSGAFTPSDETKSDSILSTFNTSPFVETPIETKTDKDGFAMPTPKLPSTIRKSSTISSVLPSTVKSTANSTLPIYTPDNPPPNPLSTLLSAVVSPLSTVPQSTRQLTPFTPAGDEIKDVDSVPLNFRKLIITAFNVYEEETLIKLEDKQVKTHINDMLDGMKQRTAAKGDKLVLKLKELLDYIPKTYKGWQRSAMQKNFHR